VRAAEIKRWLRLVGSRAAEAGSEWVQAPCPLAPWRHGAGVDRNPSFGVRVEPGDSRTHCFSCGWSGSQMDLVFDLRGRGAKGVDLRRAMEMVEDAASGVEEGGAELRGFPSEEPEPVEPFPEYMVDAFEPAYHRDPGVARSGAVHPYLRARGVSFHSARRFDARWDPYRRRIVFPVRDFEGRLCGLHGRAVDPDAKPPYLVYRHEGRANPDVWLGEHWLDPERTLVVAESVFDLVGCAQVWPNAASPLSATVRAAKARRLDGFRRIVTVFDGDEAGRRGRARLAQMLPDASVRHVDLPDGADAGDVGVAELREILEPFL